MELCGIVILVAIYFVGGSFFASTYKRNIEYFFPIITAIIVGVLFVSGLFSGLYVGIVIICLLAVIALAFSIIKIKTNRKNLFGYIFTPALLIFIVLTLFLIWGYRGMSANSWDEFSHWIDIVKVMTIYGTFGSTETASSFASYYPALGLFEFFPQGINKLFHTEFSEWIVYVSFQMMILSVITPFLEFIEWKKPRKYIIALFIIPTYLLFIDSFLYYFALIEPVLGVFAGGALVNVYRRDKIDVPYILRICSFVFIVGTLKNVGLLFSVTVILYFTVDILITERKKLYTALIVVSSIVIPVVAWKIHLVSNSIKINFSRPIDYISLFKVVIGKDTTYRQRIYYDFWSNIYRQYVMTSVL